MRVNSEIHSVDKATHFHQKNHYLHAVPQKGNQYIILSSDLSSKLYPVLFHTVEDNMEGWTDDSDSDINVEK